MKVLYVIDHLGGGGAENQFVELVKRVSKSPGVEGLCFLTETTGPRYEGLVAEGVEVVTCRKPSEGRSTIRAVLQTRALAHEFQPDVVHSFLMYSTFVTSIALFGQRPRLFLSTEFSSPERILEEVRFTGPKRMLLKWAYQKLDYLATTSEGVKEELSETGYFLRDRIKVVPEGVDLSVCQPEDRAAARQAAGLPPNKRIVSIVGALVERKGHMFLLEAFARVAEEFDGLVLYIVGDGPFRKELESRTQELGIGENVVFTGYRNDAKRIIAASDVFCLPSLYEGMPNVVMESMALGTPVIATARYGVLDLIEHEESGMLVEPGDIDGIAGAMRALFSDQDLYDKVIQKAQEKIKGYDFSMTARKYLDLYREGIG